MRHWVLRVPNTHEALANKSNVFKINAPLLSMRMHDDPSDLISKQPTLYISDPNKVLRPCAS